MKFTEETLEHAVIELFAAEDIPHASGMYIHKPISEVLLKDDLTQYLLNQYSQHDITLQEIGGIIRDLEAYPSAALYNSNKAISKIIADGYVLKRHDRSQKDVYIHLIDYSTLPQAQAVEQVYNLPMAAEPRATYQPQDKNIYRFVTQLEILGTEKRIPDGIVYINGLPLVVLEFKTAVQENTTIHDAFTQLTVRYRRDIPELYKYNAFCVISDGVNNRSGSLFAGYDDYHAWRKVRNEDEPVDGINSLLTMVQGLFNKQRLLDVIRNYIYFPDTSKEEVKIVCRYPQYYAAAKLFHCIIQNMKPHGSGKGGTYFGATGCGKSYTMLYLARLLMRSTHFASPTIVLITDRTDLDDQLSTQFTNAKGFIGDENIISVETRAELKKLLQGRQSGGVFLTTIHKFTESLELLTNRTNVICISDKAHRSQVNIDQTIKITKAGVEKKFGFAKYLHDSLPNATYVGFTGTPIDATVDVFGNVVDAYTMKQSVIDGITVRIVYEGRAAKVNLNEAKLLEIEEYYRKCEQEGTNEYQIDESKKAVTQMETILGDPGRLKLVAGDFVHHYETRLEEGATVKGKVMFIASSRPIAYALYNEIIALRPDWATIRACEPGTQITEEEQKELKPIEYIKMVMTRHKDDKKILYDMLGTKDTRKELDRQYKNAKSNFKIAIVVDMWLTGFDVPFLDTMYIDKPVQQHSLIQTISRVNRTYEGKETGLVVDYIGIKSNMNFALAKYSKVGEAFQDIDKAVVIVKDTLDLLANMFHQFDSTAFFSGTPLQKLTCLNLAAEHAQHTDVFEKRFVALTKKLRSAYDLSCSSNQLSETEKDYAHFYFSIKAVIHKLTPGDAPDTHQMNERVRQMIQEALISDGIEEIFKLDKNDPKNNVDIFSADYLAKIDKIKLPNTKIKLLHRLLAMAIDEFKKTNRIKAVDFTKRLKALLALYNERKDFQANDVVDDLAGQLADLFRDLQAERNSFIDLGIDFEEKAFYDILKVIALKYKFDYPEEKLIHLSQAVKQIVDDKSKYTDWAQRDDIKAELKVDLIIVLAENGYPPVPKDEIFKEIFEQAENFRKYNI